MSIRDYLTLYKGNCDWFDTQEKIDKFDTFIKQKQTTIINNINNKMKPILHIKLPEPTSQDQWEKDYQSVVKSTNNEYHVLLTYGIEMQILNGKQLTELTFEEFKKQYLK